MRLPSRVPSPKARSRGLRPLSECEPAQGGAPENSRLFRSGGLEQTLEEASCESLARCEMRRATGARVAQVTRAVA